MISGRSSALGGKGRVRERFGKFILTLLAVFISFAAVIPMFWVISDAFKDRGRVISDPLGLPDVWHWENFITAWKQGHFGVYFINSILVVVPVVFFVLLFCVMAAYAFALMKFKFRNQLFVLFLAGLTIPLSVLIIPLFYEMLGLGLINTLWALILPQIAISMPFGILLLHSFILEMPTEILDAGRIDGCNRWQMLIYVVVPLSHPALLSLLIFEFMWTWNNFLLPVILVQKDSSRTLPVGLNFFQGQYVTDVPLMMAAATITFLPVVIVYIIFQRQFIKGIAAGSLK
ncbi:MAG: carbohydrate ABC transporter permease [Anaerolineales bacterium]